MLINPKLSSIQAVEVKRSKMNSAYLLAICASILLLQLEMAATTATESGPSEALQQSARIMGLDEVGLRELWRSRQPLVIRNLSPTGELITVTYNLSPDGTSLSRSKVTEGSLPARLEDNSHAKPQEDWEYVPNPDRHVRPVQQPSFGTTNFDSLFGSGFPRSPLFPGWEVPAGVTPQVTTKTEVDGQGRKVTTTTRTYSGTLDPGTNVFRQTFPDVSKGSGAINPGFAPSPPSALFPSSRAGPFDTNSIFVTRQNERDPVFVPVVDSTSTTQRTLVPLPTLSPSNSDGSDRTIDDFLQKVDLTASDIENNNGELVKTIVDRNGRILHVKFVLSTVKGNGEELNQQEPTK